MKKLLLISLMVVAASGMHAEAENRTVVEGRTWNYLITGERGKTTYDNHLYMSKGFHFKGTTVIEGTEYSIFRDEADREIAYMREEDSKVYLYCGDSADLDYTVEAEGKTEVLIYDFSAGKGSTFPCVGFDDTASHYGIVYEAKVEGTGTIDYEGNKFSYQDLYVSDPTFNEKNPYRFIGGLGCTNGLLPFPQFANWTSGMTKEREALFSVTDADGEIIYKNTALAASLAGYIPTDLDWQYYAESGRIGVPGWRALLNYTIDKTESLKYPYGWKYLSYEEWEQPNINEPIEYLGEKEVNEIQAYLREEDGKVYISLDSYKIPSNGGYYWYMGQPLLSSYKWGDIEFEPYVPHPGEEAVLYDYTVKEGDRYRALIYGSVICDVTVTKVTEIDSLDGSPSIYGKVIEVLPDYIDFMMTENPSIESRLEDFTLKYTSGIGNIGVGNYVFLGSEAIDRLSNGSYGDYSINNIYFKDGRLLYKGKNVAAVQEISPNASAVKLHDLHGREVSATVPGSIYIRDGKKFVAR
ncbi:MAG: hypothetical protein K2H76_07620 [Muribaculaceae bacterium]|nr:hypothetical protein [Muribaculaceae bacterium]